MRERADIQRLLRDRIDFLEDGLLVLAEEFSGWLDSSRRIDLLCLDADANLVVVELKRDAEGGHMELQALRYAAMVSAMTFDQAVQALASFRNAAQPDQDAARAEILTFLGWDTPQEESFALDTRIILAAADFGREVTTTVLWLRDRGIDVRCVRLKPYQLEGGRLLVDIQPLIPLPEAEEFQTRLGDKRQAERRERTERHDASTAFMQALLSRLGDRSQAHSGRTAIHNSKLYGSVGRSGFSLNFVASRERSRVELLIDAKDAKEHLRQLLQHREAIEADFGGPLEVLEKEHIRQCRVFRTVEGGYASPEAEWPRIHEEMIAAMLRLDRAVRSHVTRLP